MRDTNARYIASMNKRAACNLFASERKIRISNEEFDYIIRFSGTLDEPLLLLIPDTIATIPHIKR